MSSRISRDFPIDWALVKDGKVLTSGVFRMDKAENALVVAGVAVKPDFVSVARHWSFFGLAFNKNKDADAELKLQVRACVPIECLCVCVCVFCGVGSWVVRKFGREMLFTSLRFHVLSPAYPSVMLSMTLSRLSATRTL